MIKKGTPKEAIKKTSQPKQQEKWPQWSIKVGNPIQAKQWHPSYIFSHKVIIV